MSVLNHIIFLRFLTCIYIFFNLESKNKCDKPRVISSENCPIKIKIISKKDYEKSVEDNVDKDSSERLYPSKSLLEVSLNKNNFYDSIDDSDQIMDNVSYCNVNTEDNQWENIPIDIVPESIELNKYIDTQLMDHLTACDIDSEKEISKNCTTDNTTANSPTAGKFYKFL